MNLRFYCGDLNHQTFDKMRRIMAFLSLCVFVAAGLHIHAGNRVNSILDFIFGIFILVLIVYPTWLGLVCSMTLSLTLLCSALLLVISGIAYKQITWSKTFLENSGVLAYSLDVIYYAATFVMLNLVWEKPALEDNIYDDQDNSTFTDQDDIWAPFSGTGKAVTEYEVDFPKLDQSATTNAAYQV
ncbi:putative integral membrane protein [Babesia bovis T2Bo]|uniref:putative integral membrane protein n=1 Tax=Babesia bovis T2Bo TaxID=484906 RepID=UPI001C3645C2|nr:putative integral membrane protein [Babesia bovis T2Bo]KAG6440111.1 putative integral membrane protein [Babesia bovis T2Bo]